ncbi:MAG TPA: hypothetical protein VE863_15610 [Pyrinomonadaceae bacterium]|jgi:hypothetical protein|nr:hypothetical protein [Pyrinomonadaceae bacterium]
MRRQLTAVLATILLAAAVVAQPDKDLVGTWKMDASRSRFAGDRGAPASVVIQFERDRDLLRETLKVTSANGETTRTVAYAIDGRELVNGAGDERITSKVLFNGTAITLWWTDEGGVFTRRIKISPDGKVMSIAVHDSNPDGEGDDLIVLQRQ